MKAYEAGEAQRIGRRGRQCEGQSCEAGLCQPNCTCPIIFPVCAEVPDRLAEDRRRSRHWERRYRGVEAAGELPMRVTSVTPSSGAR